MGNSDGFLYIQLFSDMCSDFESDRSGGSVEVYDRCCEDFTLPME